MPEDMVDIAVDGLLRADAAINQSSSEPVLSGGVTATLQNSY